MNITDTAAQSRERKADTVLQGAAVSVVGFMFRWWVMLCNPLAYVPHYLLPSSLVPPVPGLDEK